jgi:hypothetical protein
MCPTTKNPSYTSWNISLAVKSYKNASKWWFLLSFTQLSIWKSNFLSNDLLVKFSSAFNAPKQWEPPCINLQKQYILWFMLKENLDSLKGSFSKARNNCNKDPKGDYKKFCDLKTIPWKCNQCCALIIVRRGHREKCWVSYPCRNAYH